MVVYGYVRYLIWEFPLLISKFFHCGVKRYCYEKLIGIREFSERLTLVLFKNHFSIDTGILEKNTPPLDEVDEGYTFSTCCELNFSSSGYSSTDVSTISDITLNRSSSLAYTLVTSTIGSHHTAEK